MQHNKILGNENRKQPELKTLINAVDIFSGYPGAEGIFPSWEG